MTNPVWDIVYGFYSWLCTPLGDTITPIASKALGIKPDLFHQYVIAALVVVVSVSLVFNVVQAVKLHNKKGGMSCVTDSAGHATR